MSCLPFLCNWIYSIVYSRVMDMLAHRNLISTTVIRKLSMAIGNFLLNYLLYRETNKIQNLQIMKYFCVIVKLFLKLYIHYCATKYFLSRIFLCIKLRLKLFSRNPSTHCVTKSWMSFLSTFWKHKNCIQLITIINAYH